MVYYGWFWITHVVNLLFNKLNIYHSMCQISTLDSLLLSSARCVFALLYIHGKLQNALMYCWHLLEIPANTHTCRVLIRISIRIMILYCIYFILFSQSICRIISPDNKTIIKWADERFSVFSSFIMMMRSSVNWHINWHIVCHQQTETNYRII